MFGKQLSLMAGVALAAITVTAPAAFAQVPINQTATNSSTVTNSGTLNTGSIGLGGSALFNATGALSSTSATAINQDFNTSATNIGAVTQGAINNAAGTVSNTGTINFSGSSTMASGSSAAISGAGAVSALSIGATTTTGNNTFTGQTVGNIDQGITNPLTNGASVTNTEPSRPVRRTW